MVMRELRTVLARRPHKKTQGQYLLVRAFLGEATTSRVTVLISSRIARKSHLRNRVRRILTASIRETLPNLAPAQDIMVSVIRLPKERMSATLREELAILFRKLSHLA